MNLLFLDTETTGLKEPRLIQLCFQEGEEDPNTEFYNPGKPIELGAMAVHHITQKMIEGKPEFKGSPDAEFLGEMLKKKILVAHNAEFDIGVLKNEGVDTPYHICTKRLAQRYFPDLDSHRLQALRYYFDLNIEARAHDAEGDVTVLKMVFDELAKKAKEVHGAEDDKTLITAMVNDTRKPLLLKKIWFGKHYGKTFEEIKKEDASYLGWLLQAEKKKDEADRNKDLDYTVRHTLTH